MPLVASMTQQIDKIIENLRRENSSLENSDFSCLFLSLSFALIHVKNCLFDGWRWSQRLQFITATVKKPQKPLSLM